MRPLKNGYARPGYRPMANVPIVLLLIEQVLTARHEPGRIPSNVGRQAPTAEPVRVRPPLIYILGVSRNF